MCDPITIAGIALTAGSTVVNTMAASRVQKARDQALAAERIRQSGFDQEAQALNTASQDRYQNFQEQEGQRASELGQYFSDQRVGQDQANQAATAEQTAPQSGSDITVREEQKQRGKARDFTNQQGQALGQLRSFGDVLGEIGRFQSRDASQIGQIGGFKRGSSAIVPLELDEANHAGDGLKLFGDLLNLGGGFALNKGLSGGAGAVGSTAAADPWAGLRSVGPYSAPRSGGLFNLYAR